MKIRIPEWVITTLTFPGVVLHEQAHKFACDLTGVRVHKVVHFSIKTIKRGTAGYVEHDKPKKFRQQFIITMAPLFLNTIAALITFLISGVLLQSFIQTRTLPDNTFLIFSVCLWLGISFGYHAMPSTVDSENVLKTAKERNIILWVLVWPFVWFHKKLADLAEASYALLLLLASYWFIFFRLS